MSQAINQTSDNEYQPTIIFFSLPAEWQMPQKIPNTPPPPNFQLFTFFSPPLKFFRFTIFLTLEAPQFSAINGPLHQASIPFSPLPSSLARFPSYTEPIFLLISSLLVSSDNTTCC
uniref:Uncharacterized protein n=1 Tax=Arundo donax TaxID=35708 RepID=A0A0A9F2A0_ARUDO